MKIAITADVHLTSRVRNPERFQALESILEQVSSREINTLIVAGDLFDATCKNPAEIETLFKNEQYSNINVYIIPGNHDPALSTGSFTLSNIKYIIKPQVVEFPDSMELLFLPYEENKSVGEVLASSDFTLKPNKWFLVAHGDNLATTHLRNDYEKGYYMPFSSKDIQLYQPRKVFLGHIHTPMDSDIVHYPGSPCGLDISETGIRTFIIYETENGNVDRIPIKSDVLYFQLILTVIPRDDEEISIHQEMAQRIADWHLDETQISKVRLRLKVKGYSTNRDLVLKSVTDFLHQRKISLQDPPDLSELKLSNDVTRADIATAVQDQIFALGLIEHPDEPTKEDYILSAMNQIYKG